jgi:myosin heavy subunit
VNNLEMKDMELPEKGVEDMTRLSYLHEPGVLQNMALRYFNNDIYVSPNERITLFYTFDGNFYVLG